MAHPHGSVANKSMFAVALALTGMAVYWYMSTSEEQRTEQREQLKDTANNAAKQVSGEER
jgi:hypothetical protein